MASGSELAYNWVRQQVTDGHVPAGSFIDEATICEATGVSRTPAREALNRLAGERFIEIIPRRGARVRELSPDEVLQTFEARFLIESAVVGKAIRSNEATEILTEMRRHLSAMEEVEYPTTHAERLRHLEADRLFHRAYMAAVGNQLILDFYDSLWPLHERHALLTTGALRDWYADVGDQHRAIYRSLSEGDEPGTLALLAIHLRPFSRWRASYDFNRKA